MSDNTGFTAEVQPLGARVVTGFKHMKATRYPVNLRLAEVVERMRMGRPPYHVRPKTDRPVVSFSGLFTRRGDDFLVRHSRLLMLDIDKLVSCDAEDKVSDEDDALRASAEAELAPELERVRADEHVVLAFISPSGTGLKVLVHVEPDVPDKAHHEAAFKEACSWAQDTFGWDEERIDTTSDMSRLCFLRSDPSLVLNADALPVRWDGKPLPPPPQVAPPPPARRGRVEKGVEWVDTDDEFTARRDELCAEFDKSATPTMWQGLVGWFNDRKQPGACPFGGHSRVGDEAVFYPWDGGWRFHSFCASHGEGKGSGKQRTYLTVAEMLGRGKGKWEIYKAECADVGLPLLQMRPRPPAAFGGGKVANAPSGPDDRPPAEVEVVPAAAVAKPSAGDEQVPWALLAAELFIQQQAGRLVFVDGDYYYWGMPAALDAPTDDYQDLRAAAGWQVMSEDLVSEMVNDCLLQLSPLRRAAQTVSAALGRVREWAKPQGGLMRRQDFVSMSVWDLGTGVSFPGVPWQDLLVRVDPNTGELDASVEMSQELFTPAGALPLRWDTDSSVLCHAPIAELLATWFPSAEERQWFEVMVGRMLMSLTSSFHALVVLVGEASAGKSTLLKLVGELVGEKRRWSVSAGVSAMGNRFFVGLLQGVQLLTLPELAPLHPKKRSQEEREGLEQLKKISGGDPLAGEVKGGGRVSLNGGVSAFIASNHPPLFLSSADDAEAWLRRLHLFEMFSVPKSKYKPDVMTDITPSVLSSWGRRCVELLAEFLAGRIAEPAAMSKARNELRAQALSPVDLWLSTRVKRVLGQPHPELRGFDAYESYRKFLSEQLDGFGDGMEGEELDKVNEGWKAVARGLGKLAVPPPAGKQRSHEEMKKGEDVRFPKGRRWTTYEGLILLDGGGDAVDEDNAGYLYYEADREREPAQEFDEVLDDPEGWV